MKITKISTFILRVPLGKERFFSSQCAFPERNSFLVKVETDEGISGWGEGGQYGPPEPVKTAVEKVLAPLVIGEDPLDRAVLWHKMYSNTRDFGQKGTYIEGISAIDIALWDICGKALGVPVGKLMGGVKRDAIPAYATGCYYRSEDYLSVEHTVPLLQEEALSYKNAGFDAIKIKIGLLSIEEDARRIRGIREAVGDEMKIFADCNHAYNRYTALRMGHILEENGVLFMEEPVLPEDKQGYRDCREKLDIAIAGGECEFSLYGFRDLITAGCIDIAQPDICCCGGLTEFLRIVHLAQAYHTTVLPHAWGSGIALAVALQALSTLPDEPWTANPIIFQNACMVEYDRNPNALRDDLLTEKIRLADHKLAVPQGPGLGIEVDTDVLNKYLVD